MYVFHRTKKLYLWLTAVLVLSFSTVTWSQKTKYPMNDHPNPYRTINGYFDLPGDRTWGATGAIDIAPDGESIWVAERCGTNSCAGSDIDPVVNFDQDGNVLTTFGGGLFVWPHGFHVDREGNVWVSDGRGPTAQELIDHPETANMGHVVYKFSPEGEVLLRLGEPGVVGNGTGPLLDQPSDVITGPDGSIYVADGHAGQSAYADLSTTARIVKYDRNGRFLDSWGGIGTAPGEYRTAHGLAMDSRGRLFVADRGNVRIQILDQDGNFIDEWYQFGRLSGIYIDANDVLYAADSESSATSNPGWRRGIRVGSAVTGHVWSFIPDPDPRGGISAAEGVAADKFGNIYGAEVGPRQLVRYERQEE